MLLVGVGSALAGSERAWEALMDAKLAQALDGTPAASVMYCEDVLEDLQSDDPLYGLAWYVLGQALAEQGDASGAADAWERAANAASPSLAARALLARFEQLGAPIRDVPMDCDFETDRCGLHRVWSRGTAPVLAPSGNGQVLIWATEVRPAASDALEAVFASPTPVRSVRFRARTSAISSYLRVVLDDPAAGRIQSEVFQVTEEWNTIELRVPEFQPVESEGWSGRARLLRIEDLTGLLTEERGANEIQIDDLELR